MEDEAAQNANDELDAKAAMLEQKIPTLFISKHYKRFIEENGLRMPRWAGQSDGAG